MLERAGCGITVVAGTILGGETVVGTRIAVPPPIPPPITVAGFRLELRLSRFIDCCAATADADIGGLAALGMYGGALSRGLGTMDAPTDPAGTSMVALAGSVNDGGGSVCVGCVGGMT